MEIHTEGRDTIAEGARRSIKGREERNYSRVSIAYGRPEEVCTWAAPPWLRTARES